MPDVWYCPDCEHPMIDCGDVWYCPGCEARVTPARMAAEIWDVVCELAELL